MYGTRYIAQGKGDRILGIMVESNICAGKQALQPGVTRVQSLRYGDNDCCV